MNKNDELIEEARARADSEQTIYESATVGERPEERAGSNMELFGELADALDEASSPLPTIATPDDLAELMEDCYQMVVRTKDGELLLIASGEDWYFYQGVPTEADEDGVEVDQRNGDIELIDSRHWPLEYVGSALPADHVRVRAALIRKARADGVSS